MDPSLTRLPVSATLLPPLICTALCAPTEARPDRALWPAGSLIREPWPRPIRAETRLVTSPGSTSSPLASASQEPPVSVPLLSWGRLPDSVRLPDSAATLPVLARPGLVSTLVPWVCRPLPWVHP